MINCINYLIFLCGQVRTNTFHKFSTIFLCVSETRGVTVSLTVEEKFEVRNVHDAEPGHGVIGENPNNVIKQIIYLIRSADQLNAY